MDKPDYTKYSLEELLEARRYIDAESYSERAAQLDLLIQDRQRNRPVESVDSGAEESLASVKRGRAYSLGQGLSSLFGTVFGFYWLYLTRNNEARAFNIIIAGFIITSSVVAGFFYLYNAISTRRFSEYDLTKSEIDPMDRLLGLGTGGKGQVRIFPGSYCPFCGASVAENHDYCPKCGKDI